MTCQRPGLSRRGVNEKAPPWICLLAAAVKAGALTVMVNSGEVNGVPGHANKRLLTDVLRGELGFEGLVVSDWEDVKKMVTIHRAFATEKEATLKSVLAGVDMSIPTAVEKTFGVLAEMVDRLEALTK